MKSFDEETEELLMFGREEGEGRRKIGLMMARQEEEFESPKEELTGNGIARDRWKLGIGKVGKKMQHVEVTEM